MERALQGLPAGRLLDMKEAMTKDDFVKLVGLEECQRDRKGILPLSSVESAAMKWSLLLLIAACAAPRESARAVRVTASHYQSMAGVKLSGDAGSMTCNREMITGSHLLRWYCRMGDDPAQYELGAPILLRLP